MQCTNCGNEVPNTAKVCGHCGHRLKEGPQIRFAQPRTVSPGMPNWAWRLIGGLVVIIIGLIVLLLIIRAVIPSEQPALTVTPNFTAIPTSNLMQVEALRTATLPPTITPTLIPIPEIGLFPDADTVWDNWVNRRTISSINDMTLEDFAFDFNSGLLAGQDYFPYTVNINQSQSIIWNTGWCAANETILRQNISQIEYEFGINGQTVSESKFGLKILANRNHYCFYKFAVLKDWPVGVYYVTTVKIFKSDIDDGVTQGVFPAGRKVIEYTVSVSP